MTIVALIPARMGSTRFPGKPLAILCGKPMIQHVVERTCEVREIGGITVVSPDKVIVDAVQAFGGHAVRTRSDNATGTDAVAELASFSQADLIVNVQGDLPVFHPEMVEQAIAALQATPLAMMATVCTRIWSNEELCDPNVVKVVIDREGYALYFSRARIPYSREYSRQGYGQYRHIGIYVYRRPFLLQFAQLARTPLEQVEGLEQLRALEEGYKIVVTETNHPTIEVDTPDDFARAEACLREREVRAA